MICGGSVVHAWRAQEGRKAGIWVLSAAHCLTDPRARYTVNVYVGGQAPMQPIRVVPLFGGDIPNAPGWFEIPPGNISLFVHPLYDDNTLLYDIALLRCSFPDGVDLPLGMRMGDSGVNWQDVMRVPQAPADNNIPMNCNIVGFGLTDPAASQVSEIMQYGSVQVEKSGVTQLITGTSLYDPAFHIWATGPTNAKGEAVDTCQGDSGGPLFHIDQETRVQTIYGVTSWGISCGVPRYPGVYARILPFTGIPTDRFRKDLPSNSPWNDGMVRLINKFSPTQLRDLDPASYSVFEEPADGGESDNTIITSPSSRKMEAWHIVAIVVAVILVSVFIFALLKR